MLLTRSRTSLLSIQGKEVMGQHNKKCSKCGELGHSKFYCKNTPAKPIPRVSAKKLAREKLLGTSMSLAKKPRKKPTRKSSKTALKKKLEILVKTYVKIRDDYICQRCGKTVEGTNCHASHVIPVSRSGFLQFEPLNMKVMCYHDHINWWHKHPIEAGKWFVEKFPERWEYLEALHKQRQKPYNEAQLQEKIEHYTKLIKKEKS